MPIVIKEIIVKTTVEKATRNVTIDEEVVRKIERRVLSRINENDSGKPVIRKNR